MKKVSLLEVNFPIYYRRIVDGEITWMELDTQTQKSRPVEILYL